MQQSIFDVMFPKFKFTKPIRLIELFAGYGSQHFALKYLGANVESWRIVEWAVPSIQAYKDGHCYNDKYKVNENSLKINREIAVTKTTREGNTRADSSDYITIPEATKKGIAYTDLRIRKLTPRETFRLMGVKDEDYERIAKNQSNSSLYHLAGDSIVINVLMAIFKELFRSD